jgi:hypothetical protein
MAAEVVIARRFRGPPDSANGGYACGMLGAFLEPRRAEVTLRLPPPLERPLAVEVDDGEARMRNGDEVVAEARAIEDYELEVPAPVGVEEATAARDASPFQHEHPYPGCFVCGPDRAPGDGLRVTCGPVGGDGLVAAPWEAPAEVPAELVWSVLDCPSGIAGMLLPDLGQSVLGRLAARLHRPVEPGSTCVAVGWPIDREGRKFHSGSAIFSAEGELLADARATWIELRG